MYVCICNGVTDRDIRAAVETEGARCLRDLQQSLGVATCCGCCEPCARELLATCLHESGHDDAASAPLLSAPANAS